MNDLVERVARAMAGAIVKQPRSGATFCETPTLMIADDDSNSFWELLPVARAAIAATGCDPRDIERLASGDFTLCDGYCHEHCHD